MLISNFFQVILGLLVRVCNISTLMVEAEGLCTMVGSGQRCVLLVPLPSKLAHSVVVLSGERSHCKDHE
jgi:hypothetical protein